MRFQVSQCYTEEDFAAYYRTFTKNSKRRQDRFRHLFRFYLMVSAAALAGLAGFILFYAFQMQPLVLSVPVAWLFVLVLLQSAGILLRSVLHSTDRKRVAQLWDSYPFKGEEMFASFEDNQFMLCQPYYETYYQYAAISIIQEDDSRYFLWLKNNTYVILKKSCFIDGDSAAFGPFIHQKRQDSLSSLAESQMKGM